MLSWRLTYLILLIIRLYYTISPSYIHPDEHFQGPEVLAGEIFGWKVTKTWEFTSEHPIRSILPLWLGYGLPMTILRWIFGMSVSPVIAYYAVRIFFFITSFSIEDWAIQELGTTPNVKARYLLYVASSYVTWTYQTHTFSNSIETMILAWSLVLIKRISLKNFGPTSHFWSCCLLGALVAIGTFNRITFPTFLVLPSLYLFPRFIKFPSTVLIIGVCFAITSAVAVYIDTKFYMSKTIVLTPLNNLLYNFQTDNLAKHGLHPRYTHVLINLPLLLGPYLLFIRPRLSIAFLSACSGTLILSFFKHQEARFLLPAVPLFLTRVSLPSFSGRRKPWKTLIIMSLAMYNIVLGTIFGILHQGGVVPVQAFYIAPRTLTIRDVVWWKTYSPPDWLLGNDAEFTHHGGVSSSSELSDLESNADLSGPVQGIRTWDLMGSDISVVEKLILDLIESKSRLLEDSIDPISLDQNNSILFVAPLSAKGLHKLIDNRDFPYYLSLEWKYLRHVNLDDIGCDLEDYVNSQSNDSGSLALDELKELSLIQKVKICAIQNRPGIGVWRIELRDYK
ncbi:Alg9-like mannosyltransferase family-domain-containing protein [Dipodascopsis uninucleata]